MQDLWTYNVTNQTWTWIGGSLNTDTIGNYGVLNVPAATNLPGGRSGHQMVIHPRSGVIFLFGGISYTSNVDTYWNDLWQLDPANSLWTWIGGRSNQNAKGIYGNKSVSSVLNYPGARSQHSLAIDDRNGDLYVFGGYGYDSAGMLSDTQ